MEEVESSARDAELAAMAERWNEKLRQQASGSAERAFGIGCGVGLIPVAGIIVFLYVIQVLNTILAILVAIMAALFLVGVAALLSSIARANTLKRAYQSSVEPEMLEYLASHAMSRPEFDTLLSNLLPEDAPLLAFLSPLPGDPLAQSTRDDDQE